MIDLRLPPGQLDVLCLGAHCDDIEIGCGGTLLMLAESGRATVRSVVLSGDPRRRAESLAAATAFGNAEPPRFLDVPDGRFPEHWGAVKQHLEDAARDLPTPHVVLVPRTDDRHQDHRLLAELTTTTWRDSLVLHYEIPKWDGDLGPVSHYVPLDEAVARRKWELLDEHYPSQHSRDWWDEQMFLGLMRLRGMECRAPFAEGLLVTKARLDVTVG